MALGVGDDAKQRLLECTSFENITKNKAGNWNKIICFYWIFQKLLTRCHQVNSYINYTVMALYD